MTETDLLIQQALAVKPSDTGTPNNIRANFLSRCYRAHQYVSDDHFFVNCINALEQAIMDREHYFQRTIDTRESGGGIL